jgi:hypothetical protein
MIAQTILGALMVAALNCYAMVFSSSWRQGPSMDGEVVFFKHSSRLA